MWFAFLLLVPLIAANSWIKVGECEPWTYAQAEDWDLVACSSVNYCKIGRTQSPAKITSQHTVVDGSLQALVFEGYGADNLNVSYNGQDIWIDYDSVGRFSNPGNGDGVVFNTKYIRISTHNEQLLFTGLNRLSIDIYHNQIIEPKTWETFPYGTEAYGVISMLFKIGNASNFLEPLINDIQRFRRTSNTTQSLVSSWTGLFNEFKALEDQQGNGYYSYQGSITVPPCSETVEWHVWDYEWEISQAQFDVLRTYIGGNQRPVQRQIAKVSYYDPLVGAPIPFDFSKLSNGSIAAIILSIIVIIVALLTLVFGITSKTSAEVYQNYS